MGVKLHAHLGNYDRRLPTNRPIERPIDRRTDRAIGKLHVQTQGKKKQHVYFFFKSTSNSLFVLFVLS